MTYAYVPRVGPVTVPVQFDGICEDCDKIILAGTDDAISFFDNNRCKACEALMFKYMAEAEEKAESVTF